MNNNPLVSIIIRTKDRPKLLTRALQSIAGQTYRPIEVVLVNDGGCDLEIADLKSILRDVSLNYIRLEKNTGRGHAGNVGIEYAGGDYIGFLDDDDELYPEHVSVLCNFLKGSDYKVVYSDSEIVYLFYSPELNKFIETSGGVFSSLDFSYDMLLFENFIPFPSLLFDGELLRKSGGFDGSFELYEDWDLLIRISSAIPFYHVAATTSKYTQWSKDYQIAKVDRANARESYIRVLQKHSEKRVPEIVYRYYTFKDRTIHDKEEIIKGLQERIHQYKKFVDHVEQFKINPEDNKSDAGEIHDLKKQLEERNLYIEEIHRSFGWKVLTFYRKNIKSLLLPSGTRREKLYKVTINSLLLLKEKGFTFVYGKTKNVLRRILAKKNITRERYNVPIIRDEGRSTVNARVSVIIPTKNAGEDFRYSMEKISRQKGVKEVEIIIVDSGSDDDTLTIAKKYTSKIYVIAPHEFNHGATRNFGAGKASGDFCIFMSQDAIPIGDNCIFNIVGKMQQDGGIAAATVKQVPRSDSDLFACWQLWFYNNKLLDYTKDNVILGKNEEIESLPALKKRRFIQIDNVFSCFRKDIFDVFQFNPLSYGEDLDLGMRLSNGGFKILFMTSVGVIHSHNRAPSYFLKRGYIDTKTLLKLLRYDPIHWEDVGIFSMNQLLMYILSLYRNVNHAVENLSAFDIRDYSLDRLLLKVKTDISLRYYNGVTLGDQSLDELFDKINPKKTSVDTDTLRLKYDVLMNQYLEFIDSLFEYLLSSNINITPENMREFMSALYKLFAWTCGSNIGNYIVFSESTGNANNNSYIENILGKEA